MLKRNVSIVDSRKLASTEQSAIFKEEDNVTT